MIESLDIDQSIEWLQQKIISFKETVIPTVQQTKPRSTKQWITATIRNLANKKKKILRLCLRDNATESKNKCKIMCCKTNAACKLAKTNFYEPQIGSKNGSQTLFKIVKDLNVDKNNEQQCTIDCHDMNYCFTTIGEKLAMTKNKLADLTNTPIQKQTMVLQ